MKTTLITTFAIALMVFAFNTNPAVAAGAWGVFGSNESDGQITEVAQYEPDCGWKWKLDANTGNWGWVCEYYNEGEPLADNVAWGDNENEESEENDARELAGLTAKEKQQQDEDDWNAWILEQFAFWTEEDQNFIDRDRKDRNNNPFGNETGQESQIACSGMDAIYGCSSASSLAQEIFAGLTAKEKQQQDEDDWNAWILQQFAGLRPGQQEALENDAEQMTNWAKQQFASWMDDEKKDQYGDDWFNNQDANTEQREFARESSFGDRSQSAGDGIDASLVGDIENDIIEREDTENDRVLESGDY